MQEIDSIKDIIKVSKMPGGLKVLVNVLVNSNEAYGEELLNHLSLGSDVLLNLIKDPQVKDLAFVTDNITDRLIERWTDIGPNEWYPHLSTLRADNLRRLFSHAMNPNLSNYAHFLQGYDLTDILHSGLHESCIKEILNLVNIIKPDTVLWIGSLISTNVQTRSYNGTKSEDQYLKEFESALIPIELFEGFVKKWYELALLSGYGDQANETISDAIVEYSNAGQYAYAEVLFNVTDRTVYMSYANLYSRHFYGVKATGLFTCGKYNQQFLVNSFKSLRLPDQLQLLLKPRGSTFNSLCNRLFSKLFPVLDPVLHRKLKELPVHMDEHIYSLIIRYGSKVVDVLNIQTDKVADSLYLSSALEQHEQSKSEPKGPLHKRIMSKIQQFFNPTL